MGFDRRALAQSQRGRCWRADELTRNPTRHSVGVPHVGKSNPTLSSLGGEGLHSFVTRTQRSLVEPSAPSLTDLAKPLLRHSGEPLPAHSRERWEMRLGMDLAAVRIHPDDETASFVDQLGARALTVGSSIAFGRGQYSPNSAEGDRLLGHELAHVVQQAEGRVSGGGIVQSTALEREAEEIASLPTRSTHSVKQSSSWPGVDRHAFTGRPNHQVSQEPEAQDAPGPRRPAVESRRSGVIQLAEGEAPALSKPPTPTPDHAVIPIRELIRHVINIEAQFPDDNTKQTVDRIRQLYYPGHYASHSRVLVYSWAIPPVSPSFKEHGQRLPVAFDRLTTRANATGLGDNPSPLVLLEDGTYVDLGHLLVGLYALQPNVEPDSPANTYGTRSIDFAGMIGDLAYAMVQKETYPEGSPPHKTERAGYPKKSTIENWYAWSATELDLQSNADAYRVREVQTQHPELPLSILLVRNYLRHGDGVHGAFTVWARAEGYRWAVHDGQIQFDPTAREKLIKEISTMANLWIGQVKAGPGVMPDDLAWEIMHKSERDWPDAGKVADLFLAFLSERLLVEHEWFEGGQVGTYPRSEAFY